MPDQIGNLQAVSRPSGATQAAAVATTVTNTATTNANATINTNFANVTTLVNKLRTDLIAANIIKGSA